MLKFKIINSSQYVSSPIIPCLLRESPGYLQKKNFSSKNKDNHVFIIANDFKKTAIGGAYLCPKPKEEVHDELRDLLTPLSEKSIWECSAIYLETSLFSLELDLAYKELFIKTFLHGLYEKLIEFGLENRVNFIVMRLLPETYTLTKTMGIWPYVIELTPEINPDGLFYGVLPLTGSVCEAYYNTRQPLL